MRAVTPSVLLAGPILRRVERGRAWVWLATRTAARCRAEVDVVGPDGSRRRVGEGEGRQVALGPGLFLHLVEARPEGGTFPTDVLLAYDIAIEVEGAAPQRLADVGRVGGEASIAYGDVGLPAFFVRERGTTLNLLHGSCRLLHGKGDDAFLAADEAMAASAQDVAERPAALFLTGDQIYGDEVGGPLIAHLGELGVELLGGGDDASVPGIPSLAQLAVYGREEVAHRQACLTSGKALNHLFSLGEFAAAYLVAWDESNWPERFPPAEEAVPERPGTGRRASAKLRKQYEAEVENLEVARRAIPAVRRVLANVPVYMAFDDHDVTDDWNITRQWRDNVHRSPTGRRMVANALGAFWAFQGWGNQPDHFDEDFIATVAAGPGGGRAAGEAFDRTLWSFAEWTFTAPTEPPAIVVDTRTQRRFDSADGAARLVGEDELARIGGHVRSAMATADDSSGPVIFVSAVPMFGLELQERRQKFLVGKLGPYAIDFEAWHSGLAGLVDFMELVIDDLGLRRCIILSGDVHYGINVEATFEIDGRRLSVVQLVSSSFKHSGTLARRALDLLGRAVRPDHERVGWAQPPRVEAEHTLAARLLRRPANTDEWDDDAPVFLAPEVARRVAPDQPPRYRETRRYVGPVERPKSVVVGESNVGLVTIGGGEVVHRLLGRTGGATVTHTARMALG